LGRCKLSCIDRMLERRKIEGLENDRNHAFEPELTTVLGAKDAFDALGLERFDLARNDHTAAAAEDLDVRCAEIVQELPHVPEVLNVPALVARHADALRVFLDRGVHHLKRGAVMPEMDHLGPAGEENSADHVDRGVMPVKERSRGDYPDRHVSPG